MTKTKVPTTVQDFIVLPITFPALPAFPKETTHYIYVRANAPRVPTADTPRELFLVNVPVDSTEIHIKSLFADQLGGGRIEDVEFEDATAKIGKGIKATIIRPESKKGKKRKRAIEDDGAGVEEDKAVGLLPETWDRQLHRSGATAVARFVDRASAEMALKQVKRAVKSSQKIIWGAGVSNKVPPLGSARYRRHHELTYPDPALLKASVDEYMSAFNSAETERTRQLARQRSAPDEDGFITVTRGGKGGRAPAREELTKAREQELKERDKNRVRDDFYRFQLREKMKEAAKELVDGFERDRRKIDGMREQRMRRGNG